MTITKTEVERAIALAEYLSNGNPLSQETVTISHGTLAILMEAAKCAKYRHTERFPASGAEWMLDDGSPVITGR